MCGNRSLVQFIFIQLKVMQACLFSFGETINHDTIHSCRLGIYRTPAGKLNLLIHFESRSIDTTMSTEASVNKVLGPKYVIFLDLQSDLDCYILFAYLLSYKYFFIILEASGIIAIVIDRARNHSL